MIEAVLFDMGGTLETYSYSEDMRRQATPKLNDLLMSFGIDLGLPSDELYQVISSGLKEYKTFSVDTEVELPTIRIWKEYLLSDYPYYFHSLTKHSEELTYWIEVNYYYRKMRPEVPQILSDLKHHGYQLGLISNVASLSQVPENLKLYGIYNYFSVIVLSSAYGRRKPDPAIFHHAASLMKMPTSHCAYIGDRVVRDIIGARRAGYGLALQITHDFDHGESDEGPSADAIISNLDEIIPILDKYNLQSSQKIEPNGVKALFFDAGDILYYRPRRGQPFADFLLENGVDHPELYRTAISAIKEKAYNGELNREDYFREFIQAHEIANESEIERGCEILSKADDDIIFFDGVSQTLHELKRKGYLLGIITDTAVPTTNKLRWFEAGGFGDVWDAFISSKDVGFQKPDRRIFQSALDQVHLSPEQTCFIGHSPEELDGARAIGMHTISFNADAGALADLNAEQFSDLLKIVEALNTLEGCR